MQNLTPSRVNYNIKENGANKQLEYSSNQNGNYVRPQSHTRSYSRNQIVNKNSTNENCDQCDNYEGSNNFQVIRVNQEPKTHVTKYSQDYKNNAINTNYQSNSRRVVNNSNNNYPA